MKTSLFFNYPVPESVVFPCFSKKDFSEFKIIDFKDLHTNQPEVVDSVVQAKQKNKNLTIPYVAEINGIKCLIDGHHTIVSKILNGQKKVKVMYLKF
jgi:hypothetical protein